MNLKRATVFSIFIILIMVVTLIAFAEEPIMAPADSTAVSSDQQVAPKNTNETQWAWGEVTNLDVQAKTLTLKYLDYETDQEKDLVLTVNEKTTFENIKSLDEIKIKDTLSIDYMLGVDGNNIAKNINFEKTDSSPIAVTQAAENTKPAEMAQSVTDDRSMQVAAPVQMPASAQVSVPEVVQPTVQPGTVTESSAPATEAPAQPVSLPAPAAQESQTQQ